MICRASRSSRRATPAMAIWRPMRRWCWPRPPARIRARLPKRSPPALRSRPDVARRRRGRTGLRQSEARATVSGSSISPPSSQPAPTTAARRSARARRSMSNMSRPIPTGPMHVGHCRGAVVGDALANLLAFAGYDVTKEYLINDAGAQIDVLARSVMLRYREALGEQIGEIPAGPLSRRLSRAGRPGAGRANSARPAADAGGRGARHRQGPHDRRHDGDDPRGSGAAQRPSRGVLLRAHAACRQRQGDPRGDQRPDAEGPHLQGQAAAAQGREAGRLGRPRADAVPLDRGRRRHRPAAGQVGRLRSPISPPMSPISRTRSSAASTS